MHAVKKIEELKLSDVNFNEDLELLKRLIDLNSFIICLDMKFKIARSDFFKTLSHLQGIVDKKTHYQF